MANQMEDMRNMGKTQMEQMSSTIASMTRGLQAIATETTEYSKRSLESTSALVEKLVGVKSIDTAIQLQSEFAKAQFEGFMAQASKMGELYKNMSKEAFKPMETAMAQGKAAIQS